MLTHLYELLRQRAEHHPDLVAMGRQHGLIWKTLTGREMLAQVDTLAEELAAAGVAEGDRVVLWLPNHWRTPLYVFAIWKLGAVAVPFDREMNPEAGVRILESIEPRLIIGGYGECPGWARQATLTEWWEPGVGGQTSRRAATWTQPAEPLALIVFTSGTTGTPKGVMISHTNLIFQAEAICDRVPLDTSCRLASVLPLSHLFELGTLVYALMSGAETHYVPSRRGPDILRVLQEQHITHMIVVPQLLTTMGRALEEQLQASVPAPAYRAMLAAGDHLPLRARRRLFWPVHRRLGGNLRLMIAGGAVLPMDIHALWERLGVRVLEAYGASECSPAIALAAPDGSTPFGSVGTPIRGVEVRLSDSGEVLVRGANVMRGYWKDPERTAEVLRDGWYATGDLASIDQGGNIRIVGRAKELIVLPSGLNVWPQDVEDVLRTPPSIKDAAVLAVPTDRGGATLHAYLIPTTAADRATSLNLIVQACNARLARHQRVATASWWNGPDFPRTALLKVRRHLLPLPVPDEMTQIESVLASDDPVGQAVTALARVSAVRADQTLAELGIDSLGLVDLALALEEKTSKVVDEDILRAEMTVEDVRAALAAAPALDGSSGAVRTPRQGISAAPPLWPYTWGTRCHVLAAPFDALLRYAGSPITVLGTEHLNGLPDRVILAGTHRSFADTPLVRYALAHSGARRLLPRLITANATGPHFAGAFAWFGVLAFGLHPIDQRRGQEASLRALVRVVQKSGGSVLIFPQGTHTTIEHELTNDPAVRFRAGVAHLAAALQVPVVPFGLAGPERVIPQLPAEFHGPKIAGVPVSVRRSPLAIAFGPPLTLAPGESTQAFAERLQAVCYALTRQAQRTILGVPPEDAPAGQPARVA